MSAGSRRRQARASQPSAGHVRRRAGGTRLPGTRAAQGEGGSGGPGGRKGRAREGRLPAPAPCCPCLGAMAALGRQVRRRRLPGPFPTVASPARARGPGPHPHLLRQRGFSASPRAGRWAESGGDSGGGSSGSASRTGGMRRRPAGGLDGPRVRGRLRRRGFGTGCAAVRGLGIWPRRVTRWLEPLGNFQVKANCV